MWPSTRDARIHAARVDQQSHTRTRTSAVLASVLVLAGSSLASLGRTIAIEQWTDRYVAWHKANEFRAFGHTSSADLAWWESYLLQSYLVMYTTTKDTFWLSRFCVHADTMIALMSDAPDSGRFWPGYRDKFLGWGTSRYDPDSSYQEYLVHDAQICLPVARFCRLVLTTPDLWVQFGARARYYLSVIEANIVSKWFVNWNSCRGDAEHLAGFGGWNPLPQNQFLVFGNLLLVLSDITGSVGPVPRSFYLSVPDSMARMFRSSLAHDSMHDAWLWSHWLLASQPMRYEDISHANLDISFALEARGHSTVFNDSDLRCLAHTLTRVMWDGSEIDPKFSRFVNGTGSYADYTPLADWLQLCDYDPKVYQLVRQAYLVHPEWTLPTSTSSHRALVTAHLARLASNPERERAAFDRSTASDSCCVPGPSRPQFRERGTDTGPAGSIAISPNPFRTKTTINLAPVTPASEFRLSTLRIHDTAGRLVRCIESDGVERGGSSIIWDGTDESGRLVPAGIYVCVLESQDNPVVMPVRFLPVAP